MSDGYGPAFQDYDDAVTEKERRVIDDLLHEISLLECPMAASGATKCKTIKCAAFYLTRGIPNRRRFFAGCSAMANATVGMTQWRSGEVEIDPETQELRETIKVLQEELKKKPFWRG